MWKCTRCIAISPKGIDIGKRSGNGQTWKGCLLLDHEGRWEFESNSRNHRENNSIRFPPYLPRAFDPRL
ncbi:hypothetical protein Tco_0586888 [Tanacetum coccineum]